MNPIAPQAAAVRLPLEPEDLERIARILPELPDCAGLTGYRVDPLVQHASSRSYHRIFLDGARVSSLVAMKLGPEPLRSDERVEGPAPSRLPFVDLAELLASEGVPVPRIFADASADGLVLLEDLGDETLEERLRATPRARWTEWYLRAVELLLRVHACEDAAHARRSIATARRFGEGLLRWELEHFREWGLEARGVTLGPAAAHVVDRAFERIVARLVTAPYGLSHRDFQSRNLMVGPSGLRLIDFQDALLAPVVYDLVALLRDSYVVLTEAETERVLRAYVAGRPTVGLAALDPDAALELFRWQTVQRKLKDAGRFVFIERVKGDASFLRHVPSSIAYVRAAVAGLPELAELGQVLADHVPEWSAP